MCVVSARITTVEEEREEDGRGERLCDERCIQVDAPLLLHKKKKQTNGLSSTYLIIYIPSASVTRV